MSLRAPDEDHAVDFFISCANPDLDWANWIAWQLEAAGHSVTLPARDFVIGANVAAEIDRAIRTARRTIVVLSPAYLESSYASSEWATALVQSPANEERRVLPVRVRPCEPSGLLGSFRYLELVGKGEVSAREDLLRAIGDKPVEHVAAPNWPNPSNADPPSVGPPIWNIPMSTAFAGRAEELSQLAGQLASVGTIVVLGSAGIGKAELAAQFARIHRNDYDVVWWVRSQDETVRREDYAQLGLRLRLTATGESEQPQLIRETKQWLERSARWLLIFGDAPDPSSLKALVPEGGGGHVLITSRHEADWFGLGASELRLGTWPRAESVAFLRSRTGDADARAADAIAQELGDLPLALSMTVSAINQQAITLGTFLVALSKKRLPVGGPTHTAKQVVADTLSLALDRLSSEQSYAIDLLSGCAYLAHERIPRELLGQIAAATSHADDASTDRAIALLHAHALLSPALDNTFDLHPLVQDAVRERDSPEESARWCAADIDALVAEFPLDTTDHARRSACWRLLPHCIAATDWASRLGVQIPAAIRLLESSASFLATQSDLGGANQLLQRALALAETLPDARPDELTDLHVTRADIQHRLGDLEGAHAGYLRALELCKNDLVSPARATDALHGLGLVLLQKEDYAAASNALRQALKNIQSIYGPSDLRVIPVMDDLSRALRALGELNSTRDLLVEKLALEERAFGSEHLNVAQTLDSLGSVEADLHAYDSALGAYSRALAIKERALGPDDSELATSLSGIGVLQRWRGEPQAARASLERAVSLGRAGDDHEVARALRALGDVLMELGDLTASRETHERALEILQRTEATGADLVRSLNSLGAVLFELGHLKEARATTERALALASEGVGRTPDGASALHNLGVLAQHSGELETARSIQEQALEITESTLGPHDPRTATALQSLGSVLAELGDLQAALNAQERALRLTEQTLGSEHPSTASALLALGQVQQQIGNQQAALLCCERALAIQERVLGTGHPAVAETLERIGVLLQLQGALTSARPSLERALRLREASSPRDQAGIARVLSNLGSVLQELGDMEGARDLRERALKVLEAPVREVAEPSPELASLAASLNATSEGSTSVERDRAFTIADPVVPADLAIALGEGRCVLFAGRDIATLAGYPPFAQLLELVLDGLERRSEDSFWQRLRQQLDADHLDVVLEMLGSRVESEQLILTISSHLAGIYVREAPAVRELARLPFSGVLTDDWTGYVTRAFRRRGTTQIAPWDQIDFDELLRPRRRFVVEIYGGVDRRRLLYGADEYQAIVDQSRDYARFLSSLMLTRSLLFVSTSITAIEDLYAANRIRPDARQEHWALVPWTPDLELHAERLRRRFNVTLLPYEKSQESRILTQFAEHLAERERTDTAAQGTSDITPSLSRVELANVGPFQELSLELEANHTILLGDNSSGKTSILRAIALALVGEDPRGSSLAQRTLKTDSTAGYIELVVNGQPWRTELRRERDSVFAEGPGTAPVDAGLCLAIGFPALRGISLLDPNPGAIANSGSGPGDLLPLLSTAPDTRLDNLKQWIVNTGIRASDPKDPEARQLRALLAEFFEIMRSLSPGVDFSYEGINRETFEVMLTSTDGPITFDLLSRGITAVLGWIGVVLERMYETYPESKNPTEQPVLVLVDEIDIHLHPEWQRSILPLLRERFPRMSLIATTHSPLIVTSAKDADIIHIARDDEGVPCTMRVDRAFRGASPDEVLTSPAFRMSSPLDLETDAAIAEYSMLLAHGRTPSNDERAATLASQLGEPWVDRTPQEEQAAKLLREWLFERLESEPEEQQTRIMGEMERYLAKLRTTNGGR
jgi:tetratricopeptide (TPR) repeat protein